MRRVRQVERSPRGTGASGRRPAPNCRKTLKSKLAKPGPRMLLKPAVPNRALGDRRETPSGSNHDWPGPMPPRISTSSLT